MKISVVIPVYNGARYIAKAIDSVLAQEYPAHQIIVIDDGSLDTTPEVLKTFEDKIITRRLQNSGPSTARNAGIALAEGDAIAFLDADDVWFKHKLKRQVEFARKFPESGFFVCDYILRGNNKYGPKTLRRHYLNLKSFSELNFNSPLLIHPLGLLLRENIIGTPSAVLIRREVVEKIGGFFDNYRLAEDYDYWLRCAMVTNFTVLEDVLCYKRVHDENISNNSVHIGLSTITVLQNVSSELRDYIRINHLTETLNQAIADWNFTMGHLYFDLGQKKKAFDFYWEGFLARKSVVGALSLLGILVKKIIRVLTFGALSKRNFEKFENAIKL